MNHSSVIREFTNLIEANQGIIFKVSRAYCTEKNCIDDLFQEILLQLWRSFLTYDKKRKFTTWMYQVALNTAISQYRKEKKINVDALEELNINISDDNDLETKDERATILYRAISKLNKVEKSIIILYMDDYSYDEISEIIGISVSNVGVKINRIKKKLKELLKELGYGL